MSLLIPRAFLASILFACIVSQSPASTPATRGEAVTPPGKFHTKISLVADRAAATPGAAFTVGIQMTMDKGWHTYWQNSGDAGLPTRIDWTLPEGYKAGEIQWPIPRRHIESGDILTYGYEAENMLLVRISPPQNPIAGTKITLKANVQWLECQQTCVPGNATVSLTLPVRRSGASPANNDLFARYTSLIPRPAFAESDVSFEVQLRNAALELRVHAAGGRRFLLSDDEKPDFYPGRMDEFAIGRTNSFFKEGDAIITYPLRAFQKESGPLTFRGILVYQLESGVRRGIQVEVHLSAAFCATIPVAGQQGESPAKGLLDRTFITRGMSGETASLWLYVGLAIVGGFLLNLMPCVLPVIALKIFGLVKMAGDRPGKITRLGWAFSLGILSSFLVLALLVIILQRAGQQVGWGFQFQEPLFVIAMSAVVFAFGLSLFGVFEIRLPGAAVIGVSDLIAKQEHHGKGYASSFSEGVFATILATPCTAPFLGSALGFAFSQPPGVILLIFTCVAFGMALPYLLLTARPAWLKFLPKPGDWMVTAKQFMGFLMMATLLWLLYIIGRQLGTEGIIWSAAFLLSVGVACWLIGRFAVLTATRGKIFAVWIAAVVVVVLGYWGFIESVLDVRKATAGVLPTSSEIATSTPGIKWEPFSVAGLEAHLDENKTVFIDFTADWCLTCKVNEKSVMTDERIAAEFALEGIIPIRADWTNRNPDITRLLAKFGRSGVPLYVIFPAGKPDQPIVLPEVITVGIVLHAIESATGARSVVVH